MESLLSVYVVIFLEECQIKVCFLSVLGVKSFHRLSKDFKESKDGDPKDLLGDFLLCLETSENQDFNKSSRVGDYEDENEDNDTAIGIEAKSVDHLQSEFERKVTLGCLEEAKDVEKKEAALPSEADANQMEMHTYTIEEDDYQGVRPKKDLHKHAWHFLKTLIQLKSLKEICEADTATATAFHVKESKLVFAFRCMELQHGFGKERVIGKGVQGFKTLNGRYYLKSEKDTRPAATYLDKNNKQEGDSTTINEEVKHIERGRIVKLKDYDGYFVVIGVGMKFHNKWFHLSNLQERPTWPSEQNKSEKKYRIHLRKIDRDKFGVANFKNYNEIGDEREKEDYRLKSYVAVGDLSDIEEVYGLNSVMKR